MITGLLASGSGKTLSFTYNDEGIRTSKTVNGVEHSYVLNGTQIVSESWGNHRLLYTYDVDGMPIGMQYRNTGYAEGVYDVYWFERNLQGDIVAVYDTDGTKLIAYTYDAWGNFTTTYHNGCTASSNANLNPFRYRGYYYDTELEMYYLQSRYYDPAIGRFINADSLLSQSAVLGNNMFAYCCNNPVMGCDPTGHAPEWWQWTKDSVKWVAKNVVNPFVKTVQKVFKKVDVTFSNGPTIGGTCGIAGMNITPYTSVDTEGNVAFQVSASWGITTNPGFSLSAGMTSMVSNAPDVSKLNGEGAVIGGSFFFPLDKGLSVGAGGDLNLIPDSSNGKMYYGLSCFRGASLFPGGEFHSGPGKTRTIFQFNIFRLYDDLYNAVMGW